MTLRRIAATDQEALNEYLGRMKSRSLADPEVEKRVSAIIDDVAGRGDEALVDYTRRFDCPDFTVSMLRVPDEAIARAASEVPAEDMAIIREAYHNVLRYHEEQRQRSWWTTREDGTILGQMVRPVDRAGLYVPGGQGGNTPLISSLIMNAVPAVVAGVPEIIAVTPPRADGSVNPYILAVAELAGVTSVFASGSAWGVAALAAGTKSIPAVDVIAGPGNIYVATAKRMLIGLVGIDMIAGPSEIAVIADASADPDWLAADILSQAEHDPLAACMLLTDDDALAEAVSRAIERRLAELPRGEIAAKSLEEFGAVIVVGCLDQAVTLTNAVAPEHLELAVAEPWEMLPKIRNAGAIFLGHYSPEPLGDYFAGPNHVLPTMSTARFSSALSVDHFIKKSSVIHATRANITSAAAKVARLARLEGLEAHARSVEARLSQREGE